MNLLILGRGKTGSAVAEVAHARRHHVRVLSAAENAAPAPLRPDALASTDVVIDFTTPAAVVANAEACIRAGKTSSSEPPAGTTNCRACAKWCSPQNSGFLYGSNFSIGVNLFFEIAATAGAP
jgi:4-hydroxy-tetrahydrodipicolinate reductase